MVRSIPLVLGVGGLLLAISATSPAAASGDSAVPVAAAQDSAPPTHQELSFAHPVSLQSAITVKSGAGLPVLGYRFESDSIVGDYWLDGAMSVDDFLAEVERKTRTAPEVVGAYVDGADYKRLKSRSAPAPDSKLGSDLPVYDAPPAVVPDDLPLPTPTEALAARAGGETWQPRTAEVGVTDMGSFLGIDARYSWWGLDPFAAPFIINDGWGMEFQVDFYTTNRGVIGDDNIPNYGTRPWCGTTTDVYKDWAAASNRPFNWFGWVIAGTSTILAPGSIGLYGDYNDLTDPCTASSIAVGAADPGAIPDTAGGTEELRITMYPSKGMDATSVVGAIVQPVNRYWCEQNPTMPLTDCMGVWPGDYPGPGPTGSRIVLNDNKGWRAPNLCWYSDNFGNTAAIQISCGGGDL